jgi:hypothetical protein
MIPQIRRTTNKSRRLHAVAEVSLKIWSLSAAVTIETGS